MVSVFLIQGDTGAMVVYRGRLSWKQVFLLAFEEANKNNISLKALFVVLFESDFFERHLPNAFTALIMTISDPDA